MQPTHQGPANVAHLDDHRLLRSLRAGDLGSAAELVRRVAGDGWLLALVVQQRADLADDLAMRAIVRTLTDAVDGRLARGATFRTAALRNVRDESRSRRLSVSDGHALTGDDALACFGQLAEPSRAALLLADVVLLPDDQLGHPLALPDDEARALADRAADALRQRLAHRLAGRLTDDACRAATDAGIGADEPDPHLAECATCRENHDLLVGAIDHIREALPVPPAHLDERILEAWAGVLAARRAATDGYPAVSSTLVGRLAAAGPAARRTVAAAAAAVLVGGLIAVGAGSGTAPVGPGKVALAAAPTRPPAAVSTPEPSASVPSATTTTTGAVPVVASDAALTGQLLQTLTGAVTSASIPAAAGAPSAAGANNSVQSTNVGSPTPANPASPSPTTAAPAPVTTRPAPAPISTTPATTAAPAPTTTNPLQPVIDLVNKVAHP